MGEGVARGGVTFKARKIARSKWDLRNAQRMALCPRIKAQWRLRGEDNVSSFFYANFIDKTKIL